jgi:hypothetical protein
MAAFFWVGMFLTGEKVTLDYDDRYDHLFLGRQAGRSLGFLLIFLSFFFPCSMMRWCHLWARLVERRVGRQGRKQTKCVLGDQDTGCLSLLFLFLLFSSFLCFTELIILF